MLDRTSGLSPFVEVQAAPPSDKSQLRHAVEYQLSHSSARQIVLTREQGQALLAALPE